MSHARLTIETSGLLDCLPVGQFLEIAVQICGQSLLAEMPANIIQPGTCRSETFRSVALDVSDLLVQDM